MRCRRRRGSRISRRGCKAATVSSRSLRSRSRSSRARTMCWASSAASRSTRPGCRTEKRRNAGRPEAIATARSRAGKLLHFTWARRCRRRPRPRGPRQVSECPRPIRQAVCGPDWADPHRLRLAPAATSRGFPASSRARRTGITRICLCFGGPPCLRGGMVSRAQEGGGRAEVPRNFVSLLDDLLDDCRSLGYFLRCSTATLAGNVVGVP